LAALHRINGQVWDYLGGEIALKCRLGIEFLRQRRGSLESLRGANTVRITRPTPSPIVRVVRSRTLFWRLFHSFWLLLPVGGLGCVGGLGFLYVGVRARRASWWLAGVIYLVLGLSAFVIVGIAGKGTAVASAAAGVWFALWLVSIVHACIVNVGWLRWLVINTPPAGASAMAANTGDGWLSAPSDPPPHVSWEPPVPTYPAQFPSTIIESPIRQPPPVGPVRPDDDPPPAPRNGPAQRAVAG
jgi:hypothetical protein